MLKVYSQWCKLQTSGGTFTNYTLPISFIESGYVMSTNASAAGAGYDYTGGIIDNNTIQVYSDGNGNREFQCIIIGK